MRYTANLIMAVTILTATVSLPGIVAANDDPPDLTAHFDRLYEEIGSVPELNRGQRRSLQQKVRAAHKAWQRGQACTSANVLGAFLNAVSARRRGDAVASADHLFNRGWTLRQMVVVGADPAERCADPWVGREPDVEVVESSLEGLSVVIRLAPPALRTRQRGGELWTELTVPGTRHDPSRVGEPAIPFVHRLVAVPRGAELRVTALVHAASNLRLNLSPIQDETPMHGHTPDDYTEELPPDEVFDDPPFVKNEEAYAIDRGLPSTPCRLEPVGTFRDLEMAALACAAGRYNPVQDLYTPFSAVEVEISFPGGDGGFVTEAALHPFETDGLALADATLNGDLVAQHFLPDLVDRLCVGEELLILTHADLRAQADALADWKRSRGLVTSVYEVNDGPGPSPDTVAEIRAFIAERYDTCAIRPSYVLLFGDAEFIPTSYEPNPVKEGIIASDFPYGIKPSLSDQWGIDWAVTRVPVDLGDAQVYVDKVIGYEGNPPHSFDPFYNRVGIASQFECCQIDEFYLDDDIPGPAPGTDQRAFIQVVEDVRSRLMAEGFSVERIYTKTVDPNYIFDQTPLFYADGSDLPVVLQPSYPWPGDTTDIAAAWEQGRFLMIHLDHGGASGWSHPKFNRFDAAALTNGGRLPFVLGYNCSSGYFDNETVPGGNLSTVYFTEQLLRNPLGGAIASIAASRTTFAHGNIMIRGAVDAAFPDIDPGYGPAFPRKRIGDMLTHARLYMAWSYGWGTNTKRHFLLYHGFGDPTVGMWGHPPAELPVFVEIDLRPEFLQIWYAFEGAVVTAWQEMRGGEFLPLGRGTIRDGSVELEYVNSPVAGVPIQLAASADDAITTALRVGP